MKILHIIPSFGLGGMEKVICAIINQTYRYYDHQILSLDGNATAMQWIKGNNIYQVEFHKNGDFFNFLLKLRKTIKSSSPDLLMTYNWGATDAIWLGKLVGVKHIIHNEHGFSIEEAKGTSWKRDTCRLIVYRMASVLITVSSQLKNALRQRYRLNPQKIRMIPNGIDTSYYSPDPDVRRRMRQELKLADDDFVIVFSGRLDPVKNFELLLDAFDRCRSTDGKVKLLIVGDGPERQHIVQLCQQRNIDHSVVMVGQQVEVLPYLRAGDVFLLTSLTEQMPLTILEAMSVGLPVVASDVGEIRHIVEDGKDGFLRDRHHGGGSFAEALRRLMDPAQLQAMSRAARAKIGGCFQESTMVQHYQTVIDSFLGRY